MTLSTTERAPTATELTAAARDLLGVSRLTNTALTSWLRALPGVDQVGLEGRSAGLGTRSIKTTAKAWAIDTAISMIDLTTLEGADTPGKVRSLCAKALVPDPLDPTTPRPMGMRMGARISRRRDRVPVGARTDAREARRHPRRRRRGR